jgi:hypothetical protein
VRELLRKCSARKGTMPTQHLRECDPLSLPASELKNVDEDPFLIFLQTLAEEPARTAQDRGCEPEVGFRSLGAGVSGTHLVNAPNPMGHSNVIVLPHGAQAPQLHPLHPGTAPARRDQGLSRADLQREKLRAKNRRNQAAYRERCKVRGTCKGHMRSWVPRRRLPSRVMALIRDS